MPAANHDNVIRTSEHIALLPGAGAMFHVERATYRCRKTRKAGPTYPPLPLGR
jgi:hypothetical protein